MYHDIMHGVCQAISAELHWQVPMPVAASDPGEAAQLQLAAAARAAIRLPWRSGSERGARRAGGGSRGAGGGGSRGAACVRGSIWTK